MILDTLGWIKFNAGERDEALALLQRAASLAPANAEIQRHLETVKSAKAARQ